MSPSKSHWERSSSPLNLACSQLRFKQLRPPSLPNFPTSLQGENARIPFLAGPLSGDSIPDQNGQAWAGIVSTPRTVPPARLPPRPAFRAFYCYPPQRRELQTVYPSPTVAIVIPFGLALGSRPSVTLHSHSRWPWFAFCLPRFKKRCRFVEKFLAPRMSFQLSFYAMCLH